MGDQTPDGGNLGDTDGDGVVEDNGDDGALGGGMTGNDTAGIGGAMDNIVDGMDGNGATAPRDTDRAPVGEDSGTADNMTDESSSVVGIIIAVIVAIAVIILIIALIPKNRNKH